MSWSNTLESAALTWLLGNYTIYVGYGTASAGEDGSGLSEPSGGGYARELYGSGTVANSGNDYYIENDSDIVFDTATSNQGTISHVYFFSHLTSTDAAYFLGEVSFSELGLDDISLITGGHIEIAAGDCLIRLD